METVFGHLQATPNGLTGSEAKRRFEQVGANRLPRQAPPSLWQILLRQFRSPLIYILGVAACVSVAIGDLKDAGFIVGVLAINAVIGGYQEWRAEQSSRALQRLLKIRAAVMRDGEVCEIDAEEVVPGDVVWLESGNRVPADLRLIGTHNLEVDESLLTGESLTVLKTSQLDRGAVRTLSRSSECGLCRVHGGAGEGKRHRRCHWNGNSGGTIGAGHDGDSRGQPSVTQANGAV